MSEERCRHYHTRDDGFIEELPSCGSTSPKVPTLLSHTPEYIRKGAGIDPDSVVTRLEQDSEGGEWIVTRGTLNPPPPRVTSTQPLIEVCPRHLRAQPCQPCFDPTEEGDDG